METLEQNIHIHNIYITFSAWWYILPFRAYTLTEIILLSTNTANNFLESYTNFWCLHDKTNIKAFLCLHYRRSHSNLLIVGSLLQQTSSLFASFVHINITAIILFLVHIKQLVLMKLQVASVLIKYIVICWGEAWILFQLINAAPVYTI